MKKEENQTTSEIFKKTLSGFLIILGLVVVLITGNRITGNVIGANQALKLADLAVAIWGLIIVFAGVFIGFIKE